MPYLIEFLDTGEEKIHHLSLGLYKIGRNLDSDIFIDNYTISRNHAEIIIKPDLTIVKDCQSVNHTYVNNVEIVESAIKEGDLITFGSANFRFTTKNQSVSNYMSPQLPTSLVEGNVDQSIIKKFNYADKLPFIDNLIAKKRISFDKNSENNLNYKTVQKLTLLLEISQKLCSPQEPDKMLATIVKLIFQVINIDRAVILLVDEKSQKLVCRAIKLADGIQDNGYIYSSNIVNLVRKTGETLLITNALKDDRFQQSNSIIFSSIHAAICVPLIVHHNTIGVLYVDNLSMSSIYSDADVEFLAGIAAIAATAIQMANTFNKREQALKNQIKELKIQIDHEQKKAELDEVMDDLDLDLFQKIAKKWKNND